MNLSLIILLSCAILASFVKSDEVSDDEAADELISDAAFDEIMESPELVRIIKDKIRDRIKSGLSSILGGLIGAPPPSPPAAGWKTSKNIHAGGKIQKNNHCWNIFQHNLEDFLRLCEKINKIRCKMFVSFIIHVDGSSWKQLYCWKCALRTEQ